MKIFQNFIYLLNAYIYDKEYPEMMFALAIAHVSVTKRVKKIMLDKNEHT